MAVFTFFTLGGLIYRAFYYKLYTVTRAQLIERTKHWLDPNVARWRYQGTRDKYHYFNFSDLPWGGDKEQYRISESELKIPDPFPFTLNRIKWRLMPWGPLAPRDLPPAPVQNQQIIPPQ